MHAALHDHHPGHPHGGRLTAIRSRPAFWRCCFRRKSVRSGLSTLFSGYGHPSWTRFRTTFSGYGNRSWIDASEWSPFLGDDASKSCTSPNFRRLSHIAINGTSISQDSCHHVTQIKAPKYMKIQYAALPDRILGLELAIVAWPTRWSWCARATSARCGACARAARPRPSSRPATSG